MGFLMKQTRPITLALREATITALAHLAAEEERSRSQTADRLLRAALATHVAREAAPTQQQGRGP